VKAALAFEPLLNPIFERERFASDERCIVTRMCGKPDTGDIDQERLSMVIAIMSKELHICRGKARACRSFRIPFISPATQG